MKITPLRAVGLAISSAVVFAAAGCSVDLGQVFSSSDNAGDSGGQAGSGLQGGGGEGGGQGGSATTGEGGTTTSSTTTTTATTTSTTTTSTTTTTTTTTTATGPMGGTLPCGDGNACDRGGVEICCWNDFIGGGAGGCQSPDSGQCNNSVSQQGLDSIIACQNDSNCNPGQVCCGNRVFFNINGNQTAFYDVVQCQDACDFPALVLCKGDGDNANCPVVSDQGQQIQTSCKESSRLPPGYFICATQ